MEVTSHHNKRFFTFTGDPNNPEPRGDDIVRLPILERLGHVKPNWAKRRNTPGFKEKTVNACGYLFILDGSPLSVDHDTARRLENNSHFTECYRA